MDFRIAATFTDGHARPTGERAESREDDGLRSPAQSFESSYAPSQAREVKGPELLVGPRQWRYPTDRASDGVEPSLMLCYVDHHDAAYSTAFRPSFCSISAMDCRA